MPVPALTFPAVVDRLRAVGCVFAEDEARLLFESAPNPVELDAMVARRETGLPLEHVLGWVEFYGLRLVVEAGVFVPRKRTEFLVYQGIGLAPPGACVVDLCCGCGALGRAVAESVADVELHAADVDEVAVACARRNIAPVGGHAYVGDLFDALPGELRGCVDLLLANVPYVPAGEIAQMPPEARLHEPHTALDGGEDGLEVLARVASAAPQWLGPNGHLLFETGERQAAAALDIVADAGLTPNLATSGDQGATVVTGTKDARRLL
jgi:release factor glutamine methyltransferase